jgi:pyruvate/2-oxoglutarate/acetoin dehydrogenase E1 component
MVWHGMMAARILVDEGIDVEVIDVRTIRPLDENSIGTSVRKTGRAVVIAEACKTYGPTSEWGMVIMEQAFDYLQAPIIRLAGRDSPVPFADSIERGIWPETQDVLDAIRAVMNY